MKTEVKKLDSSKREISIEVSGEIVKNKFEDVFGRIAKEAKVKGFRPGHVPREILEKHYSDQAHEHVLKELVPEIYNQAIEKEKLDVIELPNITDIKLDRASLSFKATVELSPEIEVKQYKGLRIEYKKITVTADEVKRNIDSLKEARKAETIDDNLAKSLGYPNLAELEKAIERQIFMQKENQQRQKIESGLIESITGELNFKLPQYMLERQLQDLLRQAKIDLALKGVTAEKIKEHDAALTKELEPEAKRQLKTYLVLAEIAKKENIALDEHMPQRVIELLLREADWHETT